MYLIYDIGGKKIQSGKDSLCNKWCWENWTATCKRVKLEFFLTPYTKINSKRIKDLNVKTRNYKTLRGKHRQNPRWQSKILYDPLPRVTNIKTKVNKWDLIKLKSFCTMKKTVSKVKRQPLGENNTEWKNKELISKIYKQSCSSVPEKWITQSKSRPKN